MQSLIAHSLFLVLGRLSYRSNKARVGHVEVLLKNTAGSQWQTNGRCVDTVPRHLPINSSLTSQKRFGSCVRHIHVRGPRYRHIDSWLMLFLLAGSKRGYLCRWDSSSTSKMSEDWWWICIGNNFACITLAILRCVPRSTRRTRLPISLIAILFSIYLLDVSCKLLMSEHGACPVDASAMPCTLIFWRIDSKQGGIGSLTFSIMQ